MNIPRSLYKCLCLISVCGLTAGCLGNAAGAQISGTLNGTVLDAVSRLPTACTVTIVDANGKTVTEGQSFTGGFRSQGRFTKQLPSGLTHLRITRGFETRAVDQVVEVPANGTVEVKVALERAIDLRQRGWYGGDSHVHMLHGEKTLPVDFDYVALTAQAEDLQYMSLAQAWTIDNPTPQKLRKELGARSTRNCVLTWNLEAPKNYYQGDAARCLGHCWMLGVKGSVVGGENLIDVLLRASAHDYESEKPTYANFESHQLIHAQGGAVFYTHPARWWTGSWGGHGGYPKQERMRVSNMAVELPVDTLLGPTFDGLDLITGSGEFEANAMAFDLWCLLLNHGYHLAGTASSDACFDRVGGAIPGVARTYTFLPKGFSLPGVTRAAAHGANFVTSGPLLLVSLDGQPPGSSFQTGLQNHNLQIETWASGIDPKGLSRLELLRNGELVHSNAFSPMTPFFKTHLILRAAEPSWYCVRVFGSEPQRQRAISGAFFFNAKDYRPPGALLTKVRVVLQDAQTGAKLAGSVTEVCFHGTVARPGKKHAIAGEGVITMPATMRLCASVPGYQTQTQSPFLSNLILMEFVTRLSAEDLINWQTFERVRAFLSQTTLAFDLVKGDR